jgi:hypothetical protein
MDTSSPLPAGTVTIYYTYDPLTVWLSATNIFMVMSSQRAMCQISQAIECSQYFGGTSDALNITCQDVSTLIQG